MKLVLFFTHGVSLQTWQQVGSLSREMALYQEMVTAGIEVAFVTYGDAGDLDLREQVSGIKIVCNRYRLPESLYIRLLPWLVRRAVGKTWVGKSNQIRGADIGLAVAQGFGNPYLVRGGYLYSLNSERSHGVDSKIAEEARRLERKVFGGADKVIVTTEEIKAEIVSRYGIGNEKISVIPNYVDSELYAPASSKAAQQKPLIVYVGRLAALKNVSALIEAVDGLGVRLCLIGSGNQIESLKEQARLVDADIEFMGNVPNQELPAMLNQAKLFVLPSLYEGHPKSLIEAMACGLAVIGSDVPGTRELIRHKEDGYLCGTAPNELRAAIEELLEDDTLREKLGRNARKRVLDDFSLARVADREMQILKGLAAK